jgi:Ca2+-transporting ATPase
MTNVRRRWGRPYWSRARSCPGLIIVEAGDVISADARLIEASRVEVDESPLTGESLPVAKGIAPAAEDAVLAERPSLLYKGTAVTSGSGEAVVFATGIATELGRISELVYESEEQETPLQTELAHLGRRLLWLTLAVAVAVAPLSASGRAVTATVETAVALAVAAIPEGLPIVATVALARGMRRMANRGVLIGRLAAVETLGSVGVILTDKTGTLTENEMVLTRLVLPGATIEVGGGYETTGQFLVDGERLDPEETASLRRALEIGALCNNASIGGGGAVGDPTEVALLMGASKAGIDRHELLRRMPEVIEEAFDPGLMMMATVHELANGGFLVAVKGAPDAVMGACSTVGETEDPLTINPQRTWNRWQTATTASGWPGGKPSIPLMPNPYRGGAVDPPVTRYETPSRSVDKRASRS